MTVLVTGSSTGIGKATAKELARQGHRVYAGVRSQEACEKLAGIANLHPLILDVTDAASIQEALARITKDGAGLDALVNNAGIVVAGPIELLPMKELRQQFEVNVFGLIAMTQAFLPMLRKSHGRIVNVGSIAGKVTTPFIGAYSGSKYAVEAFSDALRRELEPQGIRVSLIEPGAVKTPIWKKSSDKAFAMRDHADPELVQVYQERMTRVEKAMDKVAKNAIPVDAVVAAIAHALTSSFPKSRYLVGNEAKIAGLMARLMPDQVLDFVFRKQMN